MMEPRPVALISGASRRSGIGAAIAIELARDGWDVATTHWRAYDSTMPWGSDPADGGWLREQLVACGAKTAAVEADLGLVETPAHRERFCRQTPGGRVGRPDDCANFVRFLCSTEGGWINGQVLHSNGASPMRAA